MDETEEKKILAQLNQSQREVIKDFPSYARNKILTKIQKGYFIQECSRSQVTVQREYSSYKINRAGTTTPN